MSDVRAQVISALGEIAPEVEPDLLDDRRELREQCELDSMDFLNFLEALQARTGVEIPESAYGQIETLHQLVTYIERRLA